MFYVCYRFSGHDCSRECDGHGTAINPGNVGIDKPCQKLSDDPTTCYRCECAAAYQRDIDDDDDIALSCSEESCATDSACKNGGSCVASRCVCLWPWSGGSCTRIIIPSAVMCNQRGHFQNSASRCFCDVGYFGDWCEHEVDAEFVGISD
eukprot:TRINITY_DN1138_c0_g1_i1.p1 TRINITY_DN1138_c0_g1~~TRINITY_DN1138_c0_g1_i1.p1  ORF type:complete len:150 (-),score=18.84 TRINITY_DN1138_c0_g1_i1:46-495(-)